ncbi:efflux RND transporter periplasmic adaptor subunit [Rugamonas sp.]|uniref:efflux RND transporter periplasmic adaptor subunit n=1 Tax=Rugamonas sp. TaxID=1926287 RepID=UPI0025ED1899|nr:efflux RND transporter periplasmic adaptor subunit [Rugamonas sp.]
MKLSKSAAAMLIVALAAGYGLYWTGLQRGRAVPASASATPNAAATANKKPLYWHDPMYPAQKFDKPGKSPFMDMQLVPVFASDGDGDGGHGGVGISPDMQQNLGVRTAAVVRGALAQSVVAVGSVAYDERAVALVQARSNGYVERLYVKAPFDTVKEGQPLLALYVPDWVAAQEEFLSARRLQGGGAEDLVDAARQRMRLAGMNDEQIRQVETSAVVQARVTVAAPAGGVVSELDARVGMTVAAGTPLLRINGLATVWLLADVAEGAAARVQPGATVEARAPALPGVVFKGRINAILPQVDAATRTLKLRIELANPGARLLPGMFTTVTVTPADSREVLLVPSEAVIQTGTRSVVMMAQPHGQFLPVDVETGAEANGQTEIRRGLALGQQVVVSGQFLIDSDASLRGTATRMNAAPAGATPSTAPPTSPTSPTPPTAPAPPISSTAPAPPAPRANAEGAAR